MLRAILNAIFILLVVRLAFLAARLLTGGRRGEEIPPGSAAERRPRKPRGPRRASSADVVDVPFTEVPPPESPKRM